LSLVFFFSMFFPTNFLKAAEYARVGAFW